MPLVLSIIAVQINRGKTLRFPSRINGGKCAGQLVCLVTFLKKHKIASIIMASYANSLCGDARCLVNRGAVK